MGELRTCRGRIPRIKLRVDGPEPDTSAETRGSSGPGCSWTCMPLGGLSVFINSDVTFFLTLTLLALKCTGV